MMNNVMREDINFCCDKQKIQNIVYLVNRKRLSITICMLIYICLFITAAMLVNLLIIFNVITHIVWFISGCMFGWFLYIVFGIELQHNISSPILMEFITYLINTILVLIVLKELMHLITTLRCNCYYGVNSRNERGVYNGEVYYIDEDEDDEVYNDVQDGISNSAQ